jgi:hypothetical protein
MSVVVSLFVACGDGAVETTQQTGEVEAAASMPAPVETGLAPRLADGFGSVYGPYEEIARALSEDRMDTVAESASRLAEATGLLAGEFTAESEGVAAEDAPSVRALLPELEAAAVACAASADIEAARTAFEELSRLMVAYRDSLAGAAPLVAYCPMVSASWLQSGEEIANPYYGSEMLRCGEIVRR